MRALKFRRPWAALILEGRKVIELRSWRISPGPLVVAQSAGSDPVAIRPMRSYPASSAPGRVEVVRCRPADEADAIAACVAPDHFASAKERAAAAGRILAAWELSSPRVFPRALEASHGRLGLFDVPMPRCYIGPGVDPSAVDEALDWTTETTSFASLEELLYAARERRPEAVFVAPGVALHELRGHLQGGDEVQWHRVHKGEGPAEIRTKMLREAFR